MEEDPSKEPGTNPLESAKFPKDFTPEDIVDAKTDPDVKRMEAAPDEISPDTEDLVSEVDIKTTLVAISDHALGIMNGLNEDPYKEDLPDEASRAVEFLHLTIYNSVAARRPSAIMGLSSDLAMKEGPMYEEALDYPAGDEIDQEMYIRILENLTAAVQLISIWEMRQAQRKDIPESLPHRLSVGIDEMQCDDLAKIISRYVIRL